MSIICLDYLSPSLPPYQPTYLWRRGGVESRAKAEGEDGEKEKKKGEKIKIVFSLRSIRYFYYYILFIL